MALRNRSAVLVLKSRGSITCTTRILKRDAASTSNDPTDYRLREAQPQIRGAQLLNNPRLNKGMAFSLKERQVLGIHGLLPPMYQDKVTQSARVMENLNRQPNDLARYVQLNALQDRNERLFYHVLSENVDKLMPVVYTPTVGEACQKFGFIYRKPKGLYITIHDNTVDRIYQILANWPEPEVKALVMTDGERILGLGDLGAYGMGIPVGKLSLYVALAGVRPEWCLPILVDVGTDNQELLDDPWYIGLRHKRIRGAEYDEFIDNIMKAIVKRFGIDTLIQYEDFGNKNAFRFLDKYRDEYCMFNDDIQGTASVAVAGILAATRITGNPISQNKFVFLGAGEASIGIAQLICMAMTKEGLTIEEARERIWMLDSKGLIVKSRTDLTIHKQEFAKDFKQMKSLLDVINEVKPTGLMGAATIGKSFNEPIIRAMAKHNERPVIFALSNPTSKAECTADEAYSWSEGRVVFASGSPFDPVEYNGKTYYPGQGNNAYIFPGVALGTIACGIRHITDEHFLIASRTVAGLVTPQHLEEGRLYPPLPDVQEISVKIATRIADHAYSNGLAAQYPEPTDKESFIRGHLYDHEYRDMTPHFYEWPESVMKDQQYDQVYKK